MPLLYAHSGTPHFMDERIYFRVHNLLEKRKINSRFDLIGLTFGVLAAQLQDF